MKTINKNLVPFVINIYNDSELLSDIVSFKNIYGKNSIMCLYTPDLNRQSDRLFIEKFAAQNDIHFAQIPISLICAATYGQIEHSNVCKTDSFSPLVSQHISSAVVGTVAKATGRAVINHTGLKNILKNSKYCEVNV